MSAVNAFPLILRATVMTLQTVSWIFSVWVPAVALIAIATIAFTGAADRPRALGVIAGTAIASLALAWLLSRAA
ncbi:MAG TPA: hypothetical protein VJ276_10025, partial [Thermoanaerobaculia bacterium]|nr:hypothetical protein [Thermoanaerobaculia bacterium]